jgi:exodeoxyribonuclease-5
MSLTTEQKDVIKQIIGNLNSQQIQTLGGYAGTGKSTVIRVIVDALERKGLLFCPAAFTGKAANVLRKKGMNASTIHSLIYQPYKDENDETVWLLSDKYSLCDRNIQGFIIDEASMVSKEIHDDLISFGMPIIYVGDHGQLEPIGTKFNLMENPMYKLETVHRNAGEIAHFAEHLRKGGFAHDFVGQKQVQIVKDSAVEDKHMASVDQIICAFNKTRVKINERVRKYKGIDLTFIAKNEKIICLRNRKREGLFNGMQGAVTKIHKHDRFSFVSDGILYDYIWYDPDQFGKETNEFKFGQDANPFDYAYAITAHKSQGDEFGSVIALEQRCDKWDHRRWSYTVASRAKSSLIWIAY